MTLQSTIKLSRPRFWIYLLGPWLVAVAAADATITPTIVLLGLYLTLPANLLIYGVNDIYDIETDRLNPKKDAYETRLDPNYIPRLGRTIALLNIPFLILLAWLLPAQALVWLGLFLVAGIGYSMPPLRFKTKPFLDAASNILYVLPAFAAYVALGGRVSLAVVFAAAAWCAAMHAYSAAPDIAADKKAGLRTIATVLGRTGTLIVCAGLYFTAAALSYQYLGWFSVAAGAVYLLLMALSLRAGSEMFRWYTRFPLINTLLGFGLFVAAVLS